MLLYHGTSKFRLDKILAENRLLAMSHDDSAICTSSEWYPAKYWANLSAWTDESEPAIIKLDVKLLLDGGYTLTPYSDPIYGEGECAWEREVGIYPEVHPLTDVMKGHCAAPRIEEIFGKPLPFRPRSAFRWMEEAEVAKGAM